jgi:hypothetical protein
MLFLLNIDGDIKDVYKCFKSDGKKNSNSIITDFTEDTIESN